MVKIRCVVERITYQNPENGYSVLKCRVKDHSDLVPVVGNLLDANVGSVLLVEGNWKVDAKYGRQFAAENWEETLPATVYGMEKYLGSGLIKGVGPKFAKKIVQRFGVDTFTVIEDNVELLIEIEGIGNKRIRMIAESWLKQKEVKNIMLFLQEHQVSTSFAAKIYRQYGNDSIPVMKENPYRLADDIWGIGFKTADQIAEKLGFGKESYVRLRSGLMYTLSELSNDGHVYAEKRQLIDAAVKLLEAGEGTVAATMDDMLKKNELIPERDLMKRNEDGEQVDPVYLPPFYYAEIGVAAKLKKLAASPAGDKLYTKLAKVRQESGNNELSVDITAVEKKTGMEYDGIQADAIRRSAMAKVMVLTGGPGTGKTTTTHGIISVYKAFGLKILCAAPTGRAAKRMTEATGLEAKTIHRLLECKPPEGYQKNEDNPLEGDVLIVDECSMIDIILMNSLLKAIPPTMRLVLVGDIDQLPSVGAGNVLRDVIDSGVFPVVRLTKIFRQARTSRIIMNAHRINEGKMPEINNGKESDFFFMENEDAEAVVPQIVKLVKENLPGYYGVASNQIQVLTPMQRGVVGATNLNLALQEALNPAEKEVFMRGRGKVMMPKECLRRSGFAYREGDKVMQIRNNYDKEVFNGDIGIIESVTETDRTLSVNFDGRSIEYDVTELDELVHAYATTIHKAQGSEYPIVIMPVLMNHYIMLQRNLIYTGITRAKKVLVMIGTKKALAYAVKNVTVTKRNTMLRERLTGA
ncbi:MAG: ATP-dependent RecD-like DNA helicase [Lachnospiraceae bacterium]|nr:ATP-dependent RecD-like DNA helicase [Lachnospiraceae bacterium]